MMMESRPAGPYRIPRCGSSAGAPNDVTKAPAYAGAVISMNWSMKVKLVPWGLE
jgi:hypothetical protein